MTLLKRLFLHHAVWFVCSSTAFNIVYVNVGIYISSYVLGFISGNLPIAADQLDIYWREKDADSEWVFTFHVLFLSWKKNVLVCFAYISSFSIAFCTFEKEIMTSLWLCKIVFLYLFCCKMILKSWTFISLY